MKFLRWFSLLPVFLFPLLIWGHPHVFVTARQTFHFNEKGLDHIRCVWTHDAFFSADLRSGFDMDEDGKLSPEETEEMARSLAEGMAEFGYCTLLQLDGETRKIPTITDTKVRFDGKKLVYAFSIPCATPVEEDIHQLEIAQFDPEYFIAFEYGDFKYATVGADSFAVQLDKTKDKADSYMGMDIHFDKIRLQFGPMEMADQFAPAPPKGAAPSAKPEVAQTPAPTPPPLYPNGSESPFIQRRDGTSSNTLFPEAALMDNLPPPADMAGAGPTEKPASLEEETSGPTLFGDFPGWVAARQKKLQDHMEVALSEDHPGRGRTLLWLCLLTFAYGMLHAAGPGHGKVITASWLVGNRRRYLSGLALGSLVALFHGLSGVLVVLLGRALFQKTAFASMGSANRPLSLLSFGLIALLGFFMVALELRAIFRKKETAHSACPLEGDWQQVQMEGLEEALDESEETDSAAVDPPRKSNRQLIFLALAGGLIPCPGVVLVMLFCTALGHTLLGLILALSVTLGMSLTISVVGVAVILVRHLFTRPFQGNATAFARLESLARLGGGGLVFGLGLTFLWAQISLL